MEKLCRAYWYPLYAYLRRRGLPSADAQDVTQEFFSRLIGRNALRTVDPGLGSFRTFLMVSVKNLLANEWNKAHALKRGGDRQIISLDVADADGRFLHEAVTQDSPEKSFDRQWALTLLDRAFARLREEFATAGKLDQFDRLKVYLTETAGEGGYAALAGPLGLEPGGVATAVYRLRLRYRELVRAEVAQTVRTESELEFEMHHLFVALD